MCLCRSLGLMGFFLLHFGVREIRVSTVDFSPTRFPVVLSCLRSLCWGSKLAVWKSKALHLKPQCSWFQMPRSNSNGGASSVSRAQPLPPEISLLNRHVRALHRETNNQWTWLVSGSVSSVTCRSLSNGGLLTARARCDVLTPLSICFPKSGASLSNFHLGGSMLLNRFSKAWSDLPPFCSLVQALGTLMC